MSPRRHFLEPLLVSGDAVHVLLSERTGQHVAETIELAADSKTRTRGLLGRAGLARGTVMVIAPCNAVHTFFMRFTIDVAFVDRDGRILKLCRGLKPWRVGIAARAFAALEFAEGSLDQAGLIRGDRLTIAKI
jgi:uncharacterized membrane protein (UPF0127 family)